MRDPTCNYWRIKAIKRKERKSRKRELTPISRAKCSHRESTSSNSSVIFFDWENFGGLFINIWGWFLEHIYSKLSHFSPHFLYSSFISFLFILNTYFGRKKGIELGHKGKEEEKNQRRWKDFGLKSIPSHYLFQEWILHFVLYFTRYFL